MAVAGAGHVVHDDQSDLKACSKARGGAEGGAEVAAVGADVQTTSSFSTPAVTVGKRAEKEAITILVPLATLVADKSRVTALVVKVFEKWQLESQGLRDRFHFDEFKSDPRTPLKDYIDSFVRRLTLSPITFIAAAHYLDRLCTTHPKFLVTEANANRLFIMCLMVASKWTEDFSYKIDDWVKVTGGFIPRSKMVRAEAEMLGLLNYNLFVSGRALEAFVQPFVKE